MAMIQVLPPPLDLRKRSHEDLVEEFVDDLEMPILVKHEGDDDSSCSHSDSDSSISYCSDDDSSASSSICSNWESEGESSEKRMQENTLASDLVHGVQYATPDFTIYAQKQGYISLIRSPVLEAAGRAAPKTPVKVDQNTPEDYLHKILKTRGLSLKVYDPNDDSFLAITDAHKKSYASVSQVTRNEDLEGLKELHSRGVCLQSCNAYGESIVHIVCRRGTLTSLEFLTQHANVSVRVRDDVGRTPFHDAAWTDKPNFQLIEKLLTIAPDFLLTRDKRGHSALNYVPRARWSEWCRFLQEHPDLIENAIASDCYTPCSLS
jgi:hypothetical protein